ncbi:hypothetical protein EJV44_14005 [Ancylobacter aquaticus]|nr:hypothetical protein EJV44_14005 [Ancylobacter aquaticus]
MATDDPKKGAEDKVEAGGKPARRKPPTLDLSAREVTPVSDEAATAEPVVPASKPDASQPDSSKPDVSTAGDALPDASKPDTSPDMPPETLKPDAAAATDEVPVLDAAGENGNSTGEAADVPPPVHPVPPPAEPRPTRPLGLFGTLVVALLSGLIGGGFALGVVSTFYGAEENVDAITELEARALDLRQRLELLEARSGEAPATGINAPAELATRLDALESGLNALGSKVDALPAAPATAPAASPDDVAAVKGQVEALEQKVSALPAPAPAASPEALNAATARLDALETKLAAATAAQRASGQGTAQLVVLGTLREAVISGRPFTTELKAAQALLAEDAAPLAALEASAATGFASGPALAAQLRAATAPAPDAAGAPADEGIVATLLQGAQKLVTIRRSDDVAASPDIAKAETALAQGDFEAARAALAALPEAERTAAQPVLAALDARQAALATLAELHRRVLATLAGGSQ